MGGVRAAHRCGRGGSEGLEIGFRLALEAHHAEGDEIEAESRCVQERVIAIRLPAIPFGEVGQGVQCFLS